MNGPVSVVYAMGQGSTWNNYEIRYSLRGVEKHLSNVKDVWIVGWRPPFLKDVNHIEAWDPSYIPDTNIIRKILKACNHPDVTEDFLFINDDHFVLSDFDAAAFPYYYVVTLLEYIRGRGIPLIQDGYGRRAKATYDLLMSKNRPTKYFDIHYPILYNKQKFKEIFEAIPDKKLEDPNPGYVIKSLYANSLMIEGEPLVRDCKFKDPPPDGKHKCLSTFPAVSAAMYQYLQYKFPNPSRWEIV